MSTPIKPSDGPPRPGASEAPDAGRVEGRPGELRTLVEEAARSDEGARAPSEAAGPAPLEGIRADLAAGRIDADEAVDRLVERALATAGALPAGHRAALEARLRAALAEDPTLSALRKDLERGSQT